MKRLIAAAAAVASTGIATLGLGSTPALAATHTATRPVSSMTAHVAHVAHIAHLAHTATHENAAGHENTAGHVGTAGHAVHRQIARAVPGNGQAPAPGTASVHIPSQYGSGQYVSVVDCQGGQTPPPVRLQQPNTPLNLTGTAPTPAVAKAMATSGRYKTVYTCTLEVQKQTPAPAGKGGGLKKCELGQGSAGQGGATSGAGNGASCHKPVTLNTGFGGASGSVSAHHPGNR